MLRYLALEHGQPERMVYRLTDAGDARRNAIAAVAAPAASVAIGSAYANATTYEANNGRRGQIRRAVSAPMIEPIPEAASTAAHAPAPPRSSSP
jgi:hypothetical protein